MGCRNDPWSFPDLDMKNHDSSNEENMTAILKKTWYIHDSRVQRIHDSSTERFIT